MLAEEIPEYEAKTVSFLIKKGYLDNGSWGIPVLRFRPPSSGYYADKKVKKKAIVLHYTAGYLGGDLSTLTTNGSRVSVPFVISRSGDIFQLFDPAVWSFHLGNGAMGGNTQCSSQSIAIEVSNIGWLDKQGDWMWTYTGDKYCRASQTGFYTTLPEDYRGKRYFATFTPEQYNALNELLPLVSEKFGIPGKFLPNSDRYLTFQNPEQARSYEGIASHVNFRPSEKWDIGPAFDWGKLGG